jgi:hypothetical protein
MELEMNLLDWNGNKLEQKLELEDMKPTNKLNQIVSVMQDISILSPILYSREF